MKKAYIQPEVEVLSLTSLEDFLNASTSVPKDWGDTEDDFEDDTNWN